MGGARYPRGACDVFKSAMHRSRDSVVSCQHNRDKGYRKWLRESRSIHADWKYVVSSVSCREDTGRSLKTRSKSIHPSFVPSLLATCWTEGPIFFIIYVYFPYANILFEGPDMQLNLWVPSFVGLCQGPRQVICLIVVTICSLPSLG